MEEDFDASQGADLLSLALGRQPGASDLDDYVDFEAAARILRKIGMPGTGTHFFYRKDPLSQDQTLSKSGLTRLNPNPFGDSEMSRSGLS
eukprot:s598_g26.t1